MRTFLTRAVAFATAMTAAAVAAVPAGALASPAPKPTTSGSADFSVSTSGEPVKPDASGTVRTTILVANNGIHDLTVKLRSVRVRALDNGRTQFEDSDPIWSRHVSMTPSLRLAPHTYKSVAVKIDVPTDLAPDLYLLGFVAEAQPVDPRAAVRIYHRIGAVVVVEVAGSRQRHLELTIEQTGLIRIGSTFDGAFRIKNIGDATAMARSQVALGSALTGKALGSVRVSDGMQLIPTATYRRAGFSYQVRGLFMYARPQAQVLYGNGTPTLLTITAEGRPMLVIPWLTIILICLIISMIVAYVFWRRRVRAARRRADQRAEENAAAVVGRRTARHDHAGTTA